MSGAPHPYDVRRLAEDIAGELGRALMVSARALDRLTVEVMVGGQVIASGDAFDDGEVVLDGHDVRTGAGFVDVLELRLRHMVDRGELVLGGQP